MTTKTIVRSHRHQGSAQALCERGQSVRVTSLDDGGHAVTHEGVVTSVGAGSQGYLYLHLALGGGHVASVHAREIWIDGTAKGA